MDLCRFNIWPRCGRINDVRPAIVLIDHNMETTVRSFINYRYRRVQLSRSTSGPGVPLVVYRINHIRPVDGFGSLGRVAPHHRSDQLVRPDELEPAGSVEQIVDMRSICAYR